MAAFHAAMAFMAGEVFGKTIQPVGTLLLPGATQTGMRSIMGYCLRFGGSPQTKAGGQREARLVFLTAMNYYNL